MKKKTNVLAAVMSAVLFATPAIGGADLIGSSAPRIQLEVMGSYKSGIFDESAAEIAAFDRRTARLFVTNANSNTVDVLDLRTPSAPAKLFTIDMTPFGAGVNSVALSNGLVAVAVEAAQQTDPGAVVFFDADGNYLNSVSVGALPDMLTFTPNGRHLLVANEGQPDDSYTIDPEGSVSIITIHGNAREISQADVATADFRAFNTQPIDPAIRIYGPGATVAQDLEPEYVAVSADSRTAWVTLQENNALAIIDIPSAGVTELVALGSKNYGAAENAFDASNKDGGINIKSWPVSGMYQPDAIKAYRAEGQTWLVTANEGDSRDYAGFSEELRVKDLVLDPVAYPDAATLQKKENLGRLKTTSVGGDIDGDGDVDRILSYGARSFSIWNEEGELVFDSGSDFERITAAALGNDFNSNNDENDSGDSRSDDKGPEPEGVTIGKVFGRTYAFIGLERVGGIMVYDISNPRAPQFVQYINNRDFGGDAAAGTAGDLGPEGMLFIPRGESPTGEPLLVVTNEVSGSTTVYRITRE